MPVLQYVHNLYGSDLIGILDKYLQRNELDSFHPVAQIADQQRLTQQQLNSTFNEIGSTASNTMDQVTENNEELAPMDDDPLLKREDNCPTGPGSENCYEEYSVVLQEGMCFNSYEKALDTFTKYCSERYIHFSKQRSDKNKDANSKDICPYLYVSFICIHGGKKRESRGHNVRPNVSVNHKGCPFKFVIKLSSKTKEYIVHKFFGGHENHDLNPDYYKAMPQARRLDPENANDAIKYMKAGCPTSKVRDLLQEETGKIITTRDLWNLNKRSSNSNNQKNDLEEMMEFLEKKHKDDPLSSLEVFLEPKPDKSSSKHINVVKVIFWMSSQMKHLFDRFGSTLFIDGTYGLSNKGYVLYPFLVEDEHGITRFCAWSLVSNEKKVVLNAALEAFKKAVGEAGSKRVKYVVIDKSFVEIQALADSLPHCKFVLCKFHILKTLRQYVTTHFRGGLSDTGKTIKDKFETMVHTPSEDQYFKAWESICGMSGSSKTVDDCIAYLDKNWHQSRSHWAFYLLKQEPLHLNLTNNRSEGTNSFLKREVSRNKNLSYLVESLFRIEQQQSRNRQLKTQYARNKLFAPTNLTNRKEEELLQEAVKLVGQKTIRMLLSEFREINNVNVNDLRFDSGQVTCPRISGPCTFNTSRSLPCAHLFKVKVHIGESPLLSKDMMGDEYFIHPKPIDCVKPEKQAPSQSIFTKLPKQKESAQTIYRNTKKELEGLIDNIANSNYKSRQTKTLFLNTVDDFWKEGKTLQLICDDKPVLPESEDSDLEIVPSSQDFQSSLKFSPKVIRHHRVKVEGNHKFKKRLKLQETELSSNEDLDEINQINKNLKPLGLKFVWDQRSLNYLKSDPLSGSNAYLDDVALASASKLLNHKFPTLFGLEETWLYESFGYTAIEPGQKFIQAIYNGSNHWLMATNLGLPQNAKDNEIILYDSLITMQPNSQNIYQLNSSVKLQCCQIMRKILTVKKFSTILVHIKHCQQQQNSTDCGLFSIANMVAVAHGSDPGDLYYPPMSLRPAYLDMLKMGEIKQFPSEPRHSGNEHFFKVNVQLGLMQKLIEGQDYTRMIEAICHCKLPSDLEALLYCHGCQKGFHPSCYLLPKVSLITKEVIEHFQCYQCRSSDSGYRLLKDTSVVPDHLKIKQTSDKILRIMPHVLQKVIPKVIRFEHKVTNPWDKNTITFINNLTVVYNLNELFLREGLIFNAMHTVFVNLMTDLSFTISFDDLTDSELLHMAVLIICNVNDLKCKNLNPLCEQIGLAFVKTDKVHVSNIKEQLQTAKKKQKSIKDTLGSLFNKSELPASQMTTLTKVVEDLNSITVDLQSISLPKTQDSEARALKSFYNFVINANNDLLDEASSFMKQLSQ